MLFYRSSHVLSSQKGSYTFLTGLKNVRPLLCKMKIRFAVTLAVLELIFAITTGTYVQYFEIQICNHVFNRLTIFCYAMLFFII